MGEIINTKGLVVRTVDVSESDRILSVLTAEKGLITVYGKGVRSIKSQRLHLSQLFAYCEITISPNGEMYYLKEGSIIEDFYSIREDITAFSLSQYIAEVISSVCVQDENHETILRLTLNTLYAISHKLADYDLIKSAFEFRISCELGYAPDLSCCAGCGENDADLYFSVSEGYCVCEDCIEEGTDKRDYYLLNQNLRKVLFYIENADLKKLLSFNAKDINMNILYSLSESYLLYHLERGFDTLTFYKKIKQ